MVYIDINGKAICTNRYFVLRQKSVQYNILLYSISKALTGLRTITNIMMVFYFILYNKYNPYLPFYTVHTVHIYTLKRRKKSRKILYMLLHYAIIYVPISRSIY